MKFRVNHRDDDMGGTSLQGYVEAPTKFETLVSVFGEPEGGSDKTLAEWVVRFEDGTIATIYDWKNYGMRREDITSWHIGGHSKRAVTLVNLALYRADSGAKDRETDGPARQVQVF